jgi:hypothetical protein
MSHAGSKKFSKLRERCARHLAHHNVGRTHGPAREAHDAGGNHRTRLAARGVVGVNVDRATPDADNAGGSLTLCVAGV